jgi:hypothetical protein
MAEGDLRIALSVESPSPRERRNELQARLRKPSSSTGDPIREFWYAAHSAGIPLPDTEGAALVGDFMVPLAQVAVPALGGVLVGWLQGRAGRKVRAKVGDIEVEAATTDDVRRLLDLVTTYKTKLASSVETEGP